MHNRLIIGVAACARRFKRPRPWQERQQASYSIANLSGPFVLYKRGAEFNSNGNVPSGYYADLFQAAGDGNMTINQS
jgi:hypothetical protein